MSPNGLYYNNNKSINYIQSMVLIKTGQSESRLDWATIDVQAEQASYIRCIATSFEANYF